MNQFKKIIIFLAAFFSFSIISQSSEKKKLVVGTVVNPPFAYKDHNQKWKGISLDLWDRIADKLNRSYEYKMYPSTKDVLEAVKKKEVDLAISAITITDKREKYLDFGHPYYITGFGVALHKSDQNNSVASGIVALLNGESLYFF